MESMSPQVRASLEFSHIESRRTPVAKKIGIQTSGHPDPRDISIIEIHTHCQQNHGKHTEKKSKFDSPAIICWIVPVYRS